MKRNGVGFRIAQGGTLTFAAAMLVFVVAQAQGGCKGETSARSVPVDEASPADTTGSGSRAEAEPAGEPASTGAGAAEPTAEPTAKPAPAATPPTKPGAKNPAPNRKPEGTFFPSSKAGPMPNFIDEPPPQQAQQAPQGKK